MDGSSCGWREGDRCSHRKHGRGTVRFVGTMVNGGRATFVGVELDAPRPDGRGHDGKVFGTRYFHCAPKHGVLTENWRTQLEHVSGSRPRSSHAAGLATKSRSATTRERRRSVGTPSKSGETLGPRSGSHPRPEPEPEPDPEWCPGTDWRVQLRPEPEPEPEPRRAFPASEEDIQLEQALQRSRLTAPMASPSSPVRVDRELMARAWAAPQSVDPAVAAKGFVGLNDLIKKHRAQLDVLKTWGKQKRWREFDSAHFDWWMFPINEPSRHGMLYTLPSREEAEVLTAIPEFLESFRVGFRLVTRGWSWNLKEGRWIRPVHHPWSGRPVRLYKMGRAAMLFGQADVFESLRKLACELQASATKESLIMEHKQLGQANVLQLWEFAPLISTAEVGQLSSHITARVDLEQLHLRLCSDPMRERLRGDKAANARKN